MISVCVERREILGVKVLPFSSDVPMTPPPVPGDSVPDVTADEPMPDTSEIPVPNSSVYAPARNPRVRWRSDALERPTPQVASPIEPSKIVPLTASPETPTTFPPWSSPRNSTAHVQRMIRPCQNSRMRKHHHGFVRKPKRHGILQNIHQQTFHSECRRHPYRSLRHGRRRTCPLKIRFFHRHHGLPKPRKHH